MSPTNLDFRNLLDPIDERLFFSEYWEVKPLYISRKDPKCYSSLLSASDIDYLVSLACLLRNSSVELLGNTGDTADSHNTKHPASVYKAYQQGASIRINGVHRYWKPIWILCRQLEQLFSFPVRANLYCSPANTHALYRHYDQHDVLVLQIAGRKRWRVFGAPVLLPWQDPPLLNFESFDDKTDYRRSPKVKEVVRELEESSPIHELIMNTGDLLYLPRGFVHEAQTHDEISVHLTIGIHVLTWADLLTVALGQVGHQDVRFRRSLPIGFANETLPVTELNERFNELLEAFSQHVNLTGVMEELAGSFFSSEQTISDGSIAGDNTAEEIDLDTLVERRPGLLCRLVFEEDTVGLASTNNVVWMPGLFEQTLRFVAQTTEFRARALPGGMSEKSKVNLTRRLVYEGFLRTVRG